jgi:hypothetical protein
MGGLRPNDEKKRRRAPSDAAQAGKGLARRPRLEGTSNRECIYEKSSSLPGSFTGGEGNELPTKGRMLPRCSLTMTVR